MDNFLYNFAFTMVRSYLPEEKHSFLDSLRNLCHKSFDGSFETVILCILMVNGGDERRMSLG